MAKKVQIDEAFIVVKFITNKSPYMDKFPEWLKREGFTFWDCVFDSGVEFEIAVDDFVDAAKIQTFLQSYLM
jgi:hypothetical protein